MNIMLSEQLSCGVSPKDGECCETSVNTVYTIIPLAPRSFDYAYGAAQDDISI